MNEKAPAAKNASPRGKWTRWKIPAYLALGLVAAVGLFVLVIVVGVWGFHPELPRELQAPPAAVLPSLRTQRAVAERQQVAVNNGSGRRRGNPAPVAKKVPEYKDHEAYLLARRTAGGDPLAIDLYLEIMRRWKAECSRDYDTRMNFHKWMPGGDPLTAEQAAWIGARADYLALVRRYTETDGVPVPSIQEYLDELEMRGQTFSYRDFRSWQEGGMLPNLSFHTVKRKNGAFYKTTVMLTAEGWLKMATGDLRGAVADARAALKLESMDGSGLMRWNRPIGEAALELIGTWLRNGAPLDGTHRRDLLALLGELHAKHFTLEAASRPLEEQYLYQRAAVVQLLGRPWPAYMGSMRKGPGLNGEYGRWWTVPLIEKKIDYPCLGTLSIEALRALETHRHSVEFLRAYDKFWGEGLALLAKPYPEVHAATGGRLSPAMDPVLAKLFFADSLRPENFSQRRLKHGCLEARVNLVRAALALSLGRAAGRAAGAGAEMGMAVPSVAPDSPWFDPFSGKALRLDNPTSPTLVYSVGPDLVDQGGRAGDDLSLRLK